jgi:electron transfer flavoprotein alpha subunit
VIGGGNGAELGAFGASTAYTVGGEAFASFNAAPYTRALQAAVAAANPAVVLAPASLQVKEVLPRLAARLGAGLGTEVTSLRAEGGKVVGRRPMYAGKALADVHISSALALYSVRPNSFPAPAAGGGSAAVVALTVALSGNDGGVQVVDREAASSAVADLTEADRIVSGGRSVKSAEGYDSAIRPLAASIGATPGASRAAVDAGYAPHSAQVGQTGKVVNPSLYFAMGISGAIQHLAGMRTSRVIVAVNTDADAPIFQVATYGIVGDLFEIGPLLQSELKAALAS